MKGALVVHWKKAPFDVLIGRPTKWGNPYTIGKDGDRDEVIAKYEAYLKDNPYLLKLLPELEGKTLGCWCAGKDPLTAADEPFVCHGQVLAKALEEDWS